MSGLRVHAVLIDSAGRVRAGADGTAPSTTLEPGESPIAAARRALGVDARWLGVVHAGSDGAAPFVVLVLASDQPLDADRIEVPGGVWTLARARALDWNGEPPPEAEQRASGAERRQLTVLFCDLVGSTALAARIDAEELREKIASFQRACGDVVARFHGFVARYMGDGLLAYFGYPRAWGDDAERAVRAGLAIQDAMRALDDAQVRVGIATGDVVVGDVLGTGSAQERVVVGETPNLAARLQALAAPGQVLLAPSTAALVAASFELEDAGTHPLKGLPAPVPVVRAVRPRDDARRGGLLVGRDHELGDVRAAMARGERAVLVGDAGVGKSRLVDALVAESPRALRLQASPWHAGTALHPVLDALRAASASGTLTGLLPEEDAIVTPLLIDAPLPSDGEEILRRLAATMGRLAGSLLVLEDAQWADSATLAVLERVTGTRVLITTRPLSGPSLDGTRIEIGPLRDDAVEAWLEEMGIDPEARARIVQRSGGVPLYVQELARLAASGGAEAIPVTLKDALAARLGRGAARAVARSAAAFGGPFASAQLEVVHPGAEPLLVELTREGVLLRLDDGLYDFTHALLRDAAYDTLLRRDRQALHGRIADLLGDGAPEQRALHLDRAERFAESSIAWEQAARLSAGRFAPWEAAVAYGKALEAARGASAPQRRLVGLGVERAANLRVLERFDDAVAALDQAEVDGAGAGLIPEMAELWFHRGNLAFLRSDVEGCRAAHERAISIATEGGFLDEQARAWSGLGDARYAAGAMDAAHEAFVHCVQLARERSLPDIQAANLPMVAITAFFLDDLGQSERVALEALACMAGGAHRGDLSTGAVLAVCAHHRRQERREEVARILSRKFPSPTYGGFRSFALSLVATSDDEARGDLEAGLAIVGDHGALGIRGALLARRAAIEADRATLLESLDRLEPPTAIFVRLFALPHALHAARRIGDTVIAERIVAQLEQLGELGAPYATRVAAWGRGRPDPLLDAVFPLRDSGSGGSS